MGFLTIIISTLLMFQSAQATLGDVPNVVPASISENEFSKNATSASPSSLFSVSQAPYNGGVVREYMNAQGVVFAITWAGVSPIKMEDYLGVHVKKYQSARKKYEDKPQSQLGFRKPKITLTENDFVHESFGRMGAIRGRAYIPSLIPVGVQLSEIK